MPETYVFMIETYASNSRITPCGFTQLFVPRGVFTIPCSGTRPKNAFENTDCDKKNTEKRMTMKLVW